MSLGRISMFSGLFGSWMMPAEPLSGDNGEQMPGRLG